MKFKRRPGKVTGVRLKLHDLFEAPRVARELAQQIALLVDARLQHRIIEQHVAPIGAEATLVLDERIQQIGKLLRPVAGTDEDGAHRRLRDRSG